LGVMAVSQPRGGACVFSSRHSNRFPAVGDSKAVASRRVPAARQADTSAGHVGEAQSQAIAVARLAVGLLG